MSTTAADVLVDCPIACNVRIVFGLPGVTFEQTRHLLKALVRGTPEAGKVVRNIASEAIRELV